MPRPITETALLSCDHMTGIVAQVASQHWVRMEGEAPLIGNDPAHKSIAGCGNVGPTIKPCTSTLNVEAGKSTFVHIDGKPICLDTVLGGTDGTPPGATKYRVRQPGQFLVTVEA